jgi:hypothetical protein
LLFTFTALTDGQIDIGVGSGRLEDFRAIERGRGVQSAAVFAGIARDDAGLAAFRAGDVRRPFLQSKQE